MRNCSKFFGNFLGFFRFFLKFFGNFLEEFLGGFFWEDFFGRNYLVDINKKFEVILSKCKEEGGGRILILRSATQAHRT